MTGKGVQADLYDVEREQYWLLRTLIRPYGHWPRASLACTARGQAKGASGRINLDVFIPAPLP